MESCFALIGAHQHGIAVGRTGKIPAYQRLFTADTRVKGEGSLIQGDFLACAWHVSFLRREKKRKKGRVDNQKGAACPTANRTSQMGHFLRI